jgi:penicillin-binding protein 1A
LADEQDPDDLEENPPPATPQPPGVDESAEKPELAAETTVAAAASPEDPISEENSVSDPAERSQAPESIAQSERVLGSGDDTEVAEQAPSQPKIFSETLLETHPDSQETPVAAAPDLSEEPQAAASEPQATLAPDFAPEIEEAPSSVWALAAGGEAEPSAEPVFHVEDEEDAVAAPPAADTQGELPSGYFRAAGDPDEPEQEAPLTLFGRLRARAGALARQAWSYIEPRWVKFYGASRAFVGEVWRRARGIKHPRNVREAAVWSGWAAAGGLALVVGFFFFVTWGMPSTDDIWEARNGQSITFVDRNGNVILREGAQNAPPVDLEALPPYVTQAFIAIEDRRFDQHWGIDIGGMMRAGAENLRAGRVVQGGSTITQQLAKNLFLTNERSWRRKLQEMAMAIWLETRFTKEEILRLYLSRVYFGAGAYGVEAAAERYFDRPARELTLLQAAMIAGLVKAPSRLNPARQDIAAARDRAALVLSEMVGMGYISAAEREAALQEQLIISRRNPAGVLSYYRDWIDPLLNDVIGQQRDAFIVETTIDIAAQRAAAEAVESVLAEQGEARRVSQAAMIAMDDEGGVRALVGGRDYEQSQFNRATQARRQPGSSFKFFIYLAAMENGLTPWSVRDDAPITIYIDGQEPWTPGNYTNEFHGPTELTRAFAQSFNMVAIRVANEIGGQNVIDAARRLGVRSPLANYHSLALGAQEITLLEMTQAYGAMASEGYRVEAHGVARIRRANSDEVMWSWRQENRERVIEDRPLRYMNHMMRRVVEAGTGTAARISGREIGGKTGTGNDYRDAWFVGFTPGMVAGVWVGNDNFTETARVTGGSLPADIWARFMPTVLRNAPIRRMQMPRPEDYDTGAPNPDAPELTAVGAPIGAVIGAAPQVPPDNQDRSLDFGPEG